MVELVMVLRPGTPPVDFPPQCCLCLAPASRRFKVEAIGAREEYPRKYTFRRELHVPYCETHAQASARGQTILGRLALAIYLLVLVGAFALAYFVSSQDTGSSFLTCAVIFLLTGAVTGTICYHIAKTVIMKVYLPSLSDQPLGGAAGFDAGLDVVERTDTGYVLRLRMRFKNAEFAEKVAELNGISTEFPKHLASIGATKTTLVVPETAEEEGRLVPRFVLIAYDSPAVLGVSLSKAKAKTVAEEVRQLLQGGAEIEMLTTTYSNWPSLTLKAGAPSKEKLLSVLEETASMLGPGEVSDVLDVLVGYAVCQGH